MALMFCHLLTFEVWPGESVRTTGVLCDEWKSAGGEASLHLQLSADVPDVDRFCRLPFDITPVAQSIHQFNGRMVTELHPAPQGHQLLAQRPAEAL
jgi:hypothetical protein